MKKLLSAIAILGLLFAAQSWAGTVTRGSKASGGTDFSSGYTIDPDEVNTDFNTLYTLVNGNIQSVNIYDGTIADDDVSTTAAIQPSKIDDHADTDGNYIAVSDPGSTGSLSKPTSLEGDLQRLRYGIKRLALGTSIANATATWIDDPHFGPNLLYHGSFEAADGDGDNDSTTVPTGWSLSGSPTIAYATAAVSNGGGLQVQVTAAADDEGITQTLSGLKASTTYLAIARVNNSTGSGGCELKTTGGDTNASVNDSSGSYATVSDLFATDSTPTDVVLDLETNTSADVCSWDSVGVYEVGTDPLPRPGHTFFTINDTTNGTADSCVSTFATAGCKDIAQIEIIPPGPGYIVQLSGYVTVDPGSSTAPCRARIAKADTTAITYSSAVTGSVGLGFTNLAMSGVDGPLTPGTATVYEMDIASVTGTGCDAHCDDSGDGCILNAVLIPPGD